jgi:non-ribosomal peptide synthetase component E (peptide arylation enzyme)
MPAASNPVAWPRTRPELEIVDENRKEVPRGTPGEVAAKGPMIMLGYLAQTEKKSSSKPVTREWHES